MELWINKTFSCQFHPKIKFSVFLPNNHRLGKSVYIEFIHGKRHRTWFSNGRGTHKRNDSLKFICDFLCLTKCEDSDAAFTFYGFDLSFIDWAASLSKWRMDTERSGTDEMRSAQFLNQISFEYFSSFFRSWFRKFRFALWFLLFDRIWNRLLYPIPFAPCPYSTLSRWEA